MSVKSIAKTCCPPFLLPAFERIESSPIGLRLARGVYWSFMGAVISRSLGIVASILVARMLGKNGFGELGIIQSTVGMFGTFAGFGLGFTATKYVAEFRTKDPDKAGRIIALSAIVAVVTGGVMSIIFFILAPWLATHTLAAPHLAGLMRIGTLLLFLGALNGAQTGALAGFESFKTIARVNLLAGISAFPLMVGGVYIGSINGGVWGLVGSMGVNWLLNHLALRKETSIASVPVAYDKCFKEWRILVIFSLPALLTSALVSPAIWVCNAMLVNQRNGYSEMGIFNAAQQWRLPLLFISGLLAQTLLPVISERHSSGSFSQVRKVIKTSLIIYLCASLPVCLILIGLSRQIMTWYGSGFVQGWPSLSFLQVAGFLQVIQIPAVITLQATGHVWTHFLLNSIWCLVLITASYCLVGEGALGLSLAQVIAFLIYWPFLTVIAGRILQRATI